MPGCARNLGMIVIYIILMLIFAVEFAYRGPNSVCLQGIACSVADEERIMIWNKRHRVGANRIIAPNKGKK